MEKWSLNQALRRLDYKLGVEKLQGDQFCKLLKASGYWPPWAAVDKTKENYFPVENATGHDASRGTAADASPAHCPGSVERCAGALCWAALKVLNFAVTFCCLTTNWHKSCCTSSVGHPEWEVTPAHGRVLASSWLHFTFSAVSCKCSCVRVGGTWALLAGINLVI